jgi:hypothetical protein
MNHQKKGEGGILVPVPGRNGLRNGGEMRMNEGGNGWNGGRIFDYDHLHPVHSIIATTGSADSGRG